MEVGHAVPDTAGRPGLAPSGLTGTAGQYLTLQINEGTDTASGRNDPPAFTGTIQEYAVYGAQLSAQQIAWHYHANH